MSIDVEALTTAVFHVYGNVTKRGPSIGPDRPGPREGHRPREFWEEDARLIAAEYARLVHAENGPQLVKVPDLGDSPSYFVKATIPAEDEGRLREAHWHVESGWHTNKPKPAADEGRLREALAAKVRELAADTYGQPGDGLVSVAAVLDILAATPEPR